MKVLVLNSGSSSVKFQFMRMEDEGLLAKGIVEKIGSSDAIVTYQPEGRTRIREIREVLNHSVAIEMVLNLLLSPQHGVIRQKSEIDGIGHRVVHGGEDFSESVLITDKVKATIRKCIQFAPLHNPHNLKGIEACEALLPGVPQVGVFDTAFHQTIPPKAYHLRAALRPLPEAEHPALRIPRHLPQLRGPQGRRDPRPADREAQPHHLPPGQRGQHHGRGRREIGRYDDGLHASRRPGHGHALRQHRPGPRPLHHGTGEARDEGNRFHHEQEQRHARVDRDVQRHARDRAGSRPRQRAASAGPRDLLPYDQEVHRGLHGRDGARRRHRLHRRDRRELPARPPAWSPRGSRSSASSSTPRRTTPTNT